MALKIVLPVCLVIAASLALSSSEDHHHRVPPHNHRFAWPVWYRDRLLHARHPHPNADRHVVPRTTTVTTTTTRSPWTMRPQVPTTRSPQQVNPAPGHHGTGQRTPDHRSNGGAVAMAKYDGTRTITYASYQENHRHQPREAVTQSYQLIPTTAPTYTRHHSGLVYTELTSSNFFCCPGWTQMTHLSFGCNKPTCSAPCWNGGICTSPGKCTCPKGYTGNQCQIDVDECATEKPCGQLCLNLPGSYRCYCRPGFQLQQDGQSCRRNDTDENAFEARDLESDFHDVTSTKDPASHDTENEVSDSDPDYEVILKRLTKLEKLVAKNRKRDTEAFEMNVHRIVSVAKNVDEMKRTVERDSKEQKNMQLLQQEVYDLKSKMKQNEVEMRKQIQQLMSRVANLENRLRIRCRSAIGD